MHRMKRIKLHDRSFRLMIEADVIDREIERVGAQINRELAGERPLFLGVLNGIGGNAPGHLKSLLTGNHCVFPVLDGTLKLGHAVDIYFCEYDGIKNRRYMVYVVGERG